MRICEIMDSNIDYKRKRTSGIYVIRMKLRRYMNITKSLIASLEVVDFTFIDYPIDVFCEFNGS